MFECFRERVKATGCALVALTTCAEVAALCFYLWYYTEYFRAHPERRPGAAPGDAASSASEPVAVDPGAAIGIAVTFVSVLLCNILLFYGVWRRKVLCFVPWLLMHAALFLEAILAAGFCIVKSIVTWSFYTPLLGILIAAAFLVFVWVLVKDVFLSLYINGSYPVSNEERYFYTNNGSDYSRDHIEMHSFVHSSPRVSYVAAMGERVAI